MEDRLDAEAGSSRKGAQHILSGPGSQELLLGLAPGNALASGLVGQHSLWPHWTREASHWKGAAQDPRAQGAALEAGFQLAPCTLVSASLHPTRLGSLLFFAFTCSGGGRFSQDIQRAQSSSFLYQAL